MNAQELHGINWPINEKNMYELTRSDKEKNSNTQQLCVIVIMFHG